MRKLFYNPLLWIFLLALFLRLYKLGEFPVGFHVDEVKVGWNALSILKTGLDDHLNSFSLYYNSFGDYRPTGIFYLTIPSIAIFGRNIFATRLPTAIFGALTVIPIYLLIELLNKKRKINILNFNTGHLGALLMAISPWSINLSRATNEVVASAFFALFAIYFFIFLIKTQKIGHLLLFSTFIITSYLLYHPIRLLGPLFLIVIILIYLKDIRSIKIKTPLYLGFLLVCFLSLFLTFNKEGLARFDQVSIFKNVDTTFQVQKIKSEDLKPNAFTYLFDNKEVIYFKSFVDQYDNYLGADFLIDSTARPFRFTTPGTGLITYVEALILIIGIVETLKGKKNVLPLLLLLLAPIPAAITAEDAPNMSRAFFMLPFIIIIEAYGLEALLKLTDKFKRAWLIIFLAIFLNFTYFAFMYLNHSESHGPYLKDFFVDSPTYRDVGAVELAQELDTLSKKYDKIIITNFPDNPYPWYAFLTNKDPIQFNKTFSATTNERDWGNIIFSEDKCPSDDSFWKNSTANILVVDSWECDYQSQIYAGSPMKVVSKISRPDGSEVYILLKRDWSRGFPPDIQAKIKQTLKK